jgi:hypothetical protein
MWFPEESPKNGMYIYISSMSNYLQGKQEMGAVKNAAKHPI